MKTIKFIVSAIIGVIATLVLLAEIDIDLIAFFSIKLICLAVICICIRVMYNQQIFNIDEE